jgi:hypothetical protein
MSRTIAAWLGKIETTLVRRSISQLSRSMGLVEWIWLQWLFGKALLRRQGFYATFIDSAKCISRGFC